MANFGLKYPYLYLMISAMCAFGIVPCEAQTLSTGIINTDPEVLVSQTQAGNNNDKNMEISLVDIKAVDEPTFLSKDGKMGLGSEQRFGQGIIIDPSGIIATNRHIIKNAQHIYVMLSGGKIFEASLLRRTEEDLCFIKINAPLPLKAIPLANASDIQVGINVVAIANAGFNPQRKLSGQIVKVFKEVSSNKVEVLEMNIPLHPGDSGGPILNKDGSLLGLIVGKQISDPGKSYAIASSRIQQEYFNYRNSLLN